MDERPPAAAVVTRRSGNAGIDTTEVAPGSVDLALTFRNLHNWVEEGPADASLARLAGQSDRFTLEFERM